MCIHTLYKCTTPIRCYHGPFRSLYFLTIEPVGTTDALLLSTKGRIYLASQPNRISQGGKRRILN